MFRLVASSRIVTIGGTLICAAGIGYFMQMTAGENHTADGRKLAASGMIQTDAIAKNALSPESEIVTSLLAEGGGIHDIAVPIPPEPVSQPATLPTVPVRVAALVDQPIALPPKEEIVPVLICDVGMTAEPTLAALVTLTLEAQCLPNSRFTLQHDGMIFTALTDDEGKWNGNVPAFSEDAVFVARFAGGEEGRARATVGALKDFDRYVVQWKGRSGFQLHALEYGAQYGEAGHVWAEAAGDMATAAKGEGGFVVRMGAELLDDALIAEAYTFPSGTALRDGRVEISLETEVTTANCGRDIEAQALTRIGSGPISARSLAIAMPDCSAVGDFLVLKNLYGDLKIAQN